MSGEEKKLDGHSKLVLGGLAAMILVLLTASSLGKDLGLPACLAALVRYHRGVDQSSLQSA